MEAKLLNQVSILAVSILEKAVAIPKCGGGLGSDELVGGGDGVGGDGGAGRWR